MFLSQSGFKRYHSGTSSFFFFDAGNGYPFRQFTNGFTLGLIFKYTVENNGLSWRIIGGPFIEDCDSDICKEFNE